MRQKHKLSIINITPPPIFDNINNVNTFVIVTISLIRTPNKVETLIPKNENLY
ncbi:hypothetical protein SAMN03080601_01821 [Alkalitalea saponilacus]|uniref:Uncharacterized protein n=1 Tax=Alkalitalea saponilacus TaxID=889453 RepID=A0A1T5GD81_9BACT|nr:hypothetical protein SAMN03080601_01821 [Alkalitalea saponilacus]